MALSLPENEPILHQEVTAEHAPSCTKQLFLACERNAMETQQHSPKSPGPRTQQEHCSFVLEGLLHNGQLEIPRHTA